MKKYSFVLVTIVLILLLSSCSLFACKHRKCTEQVVPPTCELDGYTEYTCKKCGDVSTGNIIEKLGHSYTEEVIAANCFEEGYTKHTCTVCSNTYNDSIVEKTKHYFVGEACPNCGMEEITENITPDTEWYDEKLLIFDLTTKEQLAGLASLVNSGIDFSGVNIYLDADINLEFYEWIPIGNSEYSFNGIFDGDGHTIFGLKINANYDYVGLFGNLSGKVCNVNIEQANVYVKRNYSYVSIVCGYLTGEVVDVSTDGFIEAARAKYVGAVVGLIANESIICSNISNTAKINGGDYVGGIFGCIESLGSVHIDSVINTGDVTGTAYVGGIVGFAKGSEGSKIYESSVSADIHGEYYVGGIAGKTESVTVSKCNNEGSTISSDSYFSDGEMFYVWLGGYVGYGYSVEDCVNNSDVSYTARGYYVGGIIGYAIGDIVNCTNNGNITTYTNNVGGIVGKVNSASNAVFNNLSNTGDISGNTAIGGIAGAYNKSINETAGGQLYQNVAKGSCNIITCGKTQYYHKYCITMTISDLSNSGKITATVDLAGGIIGDVSLDNAYSIANKCHEKEFHDNYCLIVYDASLNATNLVNEGEVCAGNNAGEIFGSFVSDAPSTIDNYTVIGKVTVKSEVLEGEYDVGLNTNLTLTDRKIYGEENTNTETPETSEVTE